MCREGKVTNNDQEDKFTQSVVWEAFRLFLALCYLLQDHLKEFISYRAVYECDVVRRDIALCPGECCAVHPLFRGGAVDKSDNVTAGNGDGRVGVGITLIGGVHLGTQEFGGERWGGGREEGNMGEVKK